MSTTPPADEVAVANAGALVATDLQHAYGERVVLDGVTLTAVPGRPLGLVGDNGVGKSTLLRLLAGVEAPSGGGDVVRPPDTALLAQELPHPPETTIGQVVEEALAELRALEREVAELSALVQRLPEDAGLAREYGDALELAQARQAWDADHRVDRVVRGLGLARYPRARAIGSLTGGERARVAMAALLVRQPRALLLDEPTNHLDDAGLAFLEAHVRELPGAVVVSSHDRAFLDATCRELLDLDPARDGITRFGGSFSDYLVAKARERARWERAWRDREAELATLGASLSGDAHRVGHGRAATDRDKALHKFKGDRVERGVGRRVRSVRGRIGQLERLPIGRPPDPLRFDAPLGMAPADGDEPLVRIAGAAVDGRLPGPVDLELRAGGRLLLTGANGAGKTTLLQVLAGLLAPTAGTVERHAGLRVGLLEQDPVFPDAAATPRRLHRGALRDAGPVGAGQPSLEDLGLLREADLDRPIGVLSEGQRRRVALALLMAGAPQLVLLDEPTNHLSPMLVSDLEAALLASPCAVVLATHDRWLRRRWAGPELHLT